MGNTCACFNDDNKDKEEFKSVRTGNLIEGRDNSKAEDQEALTIQKHYRGYQARKEYSELKQNVIQQENVY
jgi:hypothetical protein